MGTILRMIDFHEFHGERPLDEAKWTAQGPGVRADAQCDITHGSKNLFPRAILYRRKKIYQCQGRLQAIPSRNYVYIWHGLLAISQDWSVRLASRLVWHKILSICFIGLQRGHVENPYERA